MKLKHGLSHLLLLFKESQEKQNFKIDISRPKKVVEMYKNLKKS